MRLLATLAAALTPFCAFAQNPDVPPGGTKEAESCPKILLPGEDWQLVSAGFELLEGPATNARGELFFNDIPTSKTYRLDAKSQPETFVEESGRGKGQAFGPDGRLYAVAAGERKIVAYNADGSMEVVAEGFSGKDLIVRHTGTIYVTEPKGNDKEQGHVWMVLQDGSTQVLDTGLEFPNGLALSPDQALLYVADSGKRWVYSFQIQTDGSLANKRQCFELKVPADTGDSGVDGLKVDTDGRLYAATKLGIQVCAPAGRVLCVLALPNGQVSNMAFGGAEMNLLYATCGDKLYKRKLRTRGAQSFHTPSPDRKTSGG